MNTKETLVLQYLPLANKLAYQKKRSLPDFVDVEDLKSAAYLGLVEAANRFDSKFDVAFSTFAYPRIFGAIHDYLREQGWFKRGDLTPVMSLDSAFDNQDCVLRDTIPSKPNDNTKENLEAITLGLDDQDKAIISYYFVEEYSMKEIGEIIGISESRVSQLLKSCKSKIRQNWSKSLLFSELAA